MKLHIPTLQNLSPLRRLGVYAAAGALTTLFQLEDRAPLSIAFLCACQDRSAMLAALCGSVAMALPVMDFTPGLRHCGILVLLSAFRDTKYIRSEYFRPAAAAAVTAVVELAYLLQAGLTAVNLIGYVTYLLLVALATHYLCLMARRRRQGADSAIQALKRRLELSAAAFRDLYNSFGRTQPRHNDENPAVVFDRAAYAIGGKLFYKPSSPAPWPSPWRWNCPWSLLSK